MWGWNYVQASTNAPNTTSSQWYREVASLGSEYPMRGTGGYSLEIAIPRFNQSTAGCHTRTIENGSIGGWTEIGIIPANVLSNAVFPTVNWTSNNSSNLTPLTWFNSFSNIITPMSIWSSNSLSNYQPSAIDKYWSFTNSMVQTLSNVAINGQLSLATNSNATSLTVLRANDAAMPNGGTRKIMFGKANSNYAQAEITYKHVGDGNTTNSLGFGFTGVGGDLLTLTVEDKVGIYNSAPTKALDVNGEGQIYGNFYVNGFSWLTGNVGIGTAPLLSSSSPKLIVDGTAQAKMLWV
jgi:hypothetical protein